MHDYFKQNVHRTLTAAEYSLMFDGIGNRISQKMEFLKDSILSTSTELDDFEMAISLGCETFSLAHEAAHILANEHHRAESANEFVADRVALSIIQMSQEDDTIVNPGISVAARPFFTVAAFLFVTFAAMQSYADLGYKTTQLAEIGRRMMALIQTTNINSFDPNDTLKLKYVDYLVEMYLANARDLIAIIAENKIEIMNIARVELDRILDGPR